MTDQQPGERSEFFEEFEFYKYFVDLPSIEHSLPVDEHHTISNIIYLKPSNESFPIPLYNVTSTCRQTKKFKYDLKSGLRKFAIENAVEHKRISNLSNVEIVPDIRLPQFRLFDVTYEIQNEVQNQPASHLTKSRILDESVSSSEPFDTFKMVHLPPLLKSILIPIADDFNFTKYYVEYSMQLEDLDKLPEKSCKVDEVANNMDLELDEFIAITANNQPQNNLKTCPALNTTSNTKHPVIDLTNEDSTTLTNSHNFNDNTRLSKCINNLTNAKRITFAVASKSIPSELFIFRLIEVFIDVPSNVTILFGRICSFLIVHGIASVEQLMQVYQQCVYWKSKDSFIVIYDSTFTINSFYYEITFRYRVKVLIAHSPEMLYDLLMRNSESDTVYYWSDIIPYEQSINKLPFLNPISVKYLLKKYAIENNPLLILQRKSQLLTEHGILGGHQISLIKRYFDLPIEF